jgi:hypothetical protein
MPSRLLRVERLRRHTATMGEGYVFAACIVVVGFSFADSRQECLQLKEYKLYEPASAADSRGLVSKSQSITYTVHQPQTISNPNAVRVKVWLDPSGCHGKSFGVNQSCRCHRSRQITFAIHKMVRSHPTHC